MTVSNPAVVRRAARHVVAFAIVQLAGAAYAQSFIPNNQVDDFGPLTPSVVSSADEKVLPPGRASPIPANQVDDFGALGDPSAPAPAVATTWHASPIQGNQIDDFSLPGAATGEKAVVVASH